MNSGRMGELMLVLCLLAWAIFLQMAGPIYCETMADLKALTGIAIALLVVATLLGVVNFGRGT